jgi:hypothetical protein
MPHDEWGNYCEESFIGAVITGLVVIAALAVILSVPGFVSAAIWGWSNFFRGAGVFWMSLLALAIAIVGLAAIGSSD